MGARRRPCAKLGYGTALVGSVGTAAHVAMVPQVPVGELYTPVDVGAIVQKQREDASSVLNCPSRAKCDEQLGRNVYAYDEGLWKFLSSRGESVVKVFDPADPNSDTKLEGELRAYRVLERLHTERGSLKPLWVEELVPRSKLEARSLRIERYTTWRALKHDAKWSEGGSASGGVSAWSLVNQVAKMHESGIAHGGLSEDTIGFAGSVGSGRFVVSGSRQIVSPLSEFYEGKLDPIRDDVRWALYSHLTGILRVGVRYRICDLGDIHGIHDENHDLLRSKKIDALYKIIEDHNTFIRAVDSDVVELRRLFSDRLAQHDKFRTNALWSTFTYPSHIGTKKVKGRAAVDTRMAGGAAEAGKVEAGSAADVKPRLDEAKRETEGIEGCPECEATKIAKGGIHGVVYPYRGDIGKVVKVFSEKSRKPGEAESNALKEIRAYGILNKISESDPAFRSIKAERIPKGNGKVRIMVDRFSGVLDDYVPKSGGYAVNEQKMLEDGVSEQDFRDLLTQLKILHRHGVAHGDAHGRNIGRLRTGGFVIVDPTWLKVSPLSELYDERVEPGAEPVLKALREATKQGSPNLKPIYRYTLDQRISPSNKETRAFLRGFGIDPSKENIDHFTSFILKHNEVVNAMRYDEKSDVSRLDIQFGSVKNKFVGTEWDFIRVFDRP